MAAISIEWDLTIKEPQAGKAYDCKGPGVVKTVMNDTDVSITLLEDGTTGEKRPVEPGETVEELTVDYTSFTASADGTHPDGEGHSEPEVSVFRWLTVDPQDLDRNGADLTYSIDGDADICSVANKSADLWITLWENADRTGKQRFVVPGEDQFDPSEDRDGTYHWRAASLSRTRPKDAPDAIYVSTEGNDTEPDPDIYIEWTYEIKDPQSGKTYGIEGPGAVSQVFNWNGLYATFWQNADATGKNRIFAPLEYNTTLALDSASVTFAEQGPHMPRDLYLADEDEGRLKLIRRFGIPQPEEKVYSVPSTTGRFSAVVNTSDEFYVTVWENADRTGRKEVVEPHDTCSDEGEDTLPFTQARAISLSRTRPEGT
jgi:hypothetical protein